MLEDDFFFRPSKPQTCGTLNVVQVSFSGFQLWPLPGSLKSEPLERPFLTLPSLTIPSNEGRVVKPLVPGGLTPLSREKRGERKGGRHKRGEEEQQERESHSVYFLPGSCCPQVLAAEELTNSLLQVWEPGSQGTEFSLEL